MADKSELTMLQEFVDAAPNTQTGALVQWGINRIAELEAKQEEYEYNASCIIATKDKRIAELEAKNEQLYQDRYDALSVTSKDGLLSSEWILRTGQAERKAKELKAEHTALVDGLRPIATEMIEPECPEDEVDDCETCQCFIDWGNRILALLGKESEDE